MATQKKKVKKKKVVRHTSETRSERLAAERAGKVEPLIPKAPISGRPKERNAGFGVLKGVGIVIAVLVVGSAILFNRAGGREAMRGDKEAGAFCDRTEECARGSICFVYGEDRRRCMITCASSKPCDSGQTCVAAASSKRKGIRVREVCVPNGEVL